MFANTDFQQVKSLTRFALKSEWRQTNKRAIGKRNKGSAFWAYWTLFFYLLAGVFLLRFFKGDASGPEFVTALSFEFLLLATISASNILLTFGSGFLAPEEVQMISPMPVSSQTFFLSRLTVLLTYTWVITLLFISATVIGLPIIAHTSVWLSIAILLSALASNTAAAMVVIVLYGLVLKKLPKQTLTKALGYVQLFGSLSTAMMFVILPRIERSINFSDWTLDAKPALALIPSFWFGSLASIANVGSASVLQFPLAALALVFVVILAVASHVLLGRNYAAEVGDLAESTATFAKRAKRKRDGILFRTLMQVARSFEARAVLMLMRAQFRYDAKFRMSLLATLPITIMYLIIALLQGGIHDPFTTGWKAAINASMLYLVALLMPIMVMQTIAQSANYKAAWIFFAAPLDRAKLLLAVRNTLLFSMVLPYMIVLVIVFSFFMPITHALPHVIVLASISGFIFQAFLMIAPRMPFAQQRRPNKNGFVNVLGVMFFAGFAAVMLGFEMYFAYGDFTRFWVSVALLLTLSVLLEQLVRSRIRTKLEREEFEM